MGQRKTRREPRQPSARAQSVPAVEHKLAAQPGPQNRHEPVVLDAETFQIVEERFTGELVIFLIEDALRRELGAPKAHPLIQDAHQQAAAWLSRSAILKPSAGQHSESVREQCRRIAAEAGITSPAEYADILDTRALVFDDLPKAKASSKPGPRRRRPILPLREGLRRYDEILHALYGGDDIKRLAAEWAPGMLSGPELASLYSRPYRLVAARLAGAPFKVSDDEMLKRVLPAARKERFKAAARLAKLNGEDLRREEYDEASVGNDTGNWVQRCGKWYYQRWIKTADGFDLGEPIRVKAPWVIPPN
jgi:hypothetical protein